MCCRALAVKKPRTSKNKRTRTDRRDSRTSPSSILNIFQHNLLYWPIQVVNPRNNDQIGASQPGEPAWHDQTDLLCPYLPFMGTHLDPIRRFSTHQSRSTKQLTSRR